MRYTNFKIKDYKAITNAEINLKEEGLVLLLGVNESGKTSVLKALETFHDINDPVDEESRQRYYSAIRNKKDIDSEATIKATISFSSEESALLEKIIKKRSLKVILNSNELLIERYFKYKDAKFLKAGYRIYTSPRKFEESDALVEKILEMCPLIQYYEDFKDQIPNYISLEPGLEHYNSEWVSVIEGLFYHADPKINVQKYLGISDPNTRASIINKVNNALNKQFTERWNKNLKGNKTITSAKLNYDENTKLFKFTVVGSDGYTVFEVAERSKGALWYLSFLLKTEFRKRHLRALTGKTLYLIDEPASNLHSSAQTSMVQDFRTLASDSNVIYTTHSQYLIDKENLSNVYIIRNSNGKVLVEKYSDFVNKKGIDTSYYQPIIDALEIQPYSLDVNWNKALLVEGIYDYIGFKLFAEILNKKLPYVIIPGTSASNLRTLISLHLGWGASLCVLLDNDEEGRRSKINYDESFPIIRNRILTLKFMNSSKNFRFEDLFEDSDKKLAYELANNKLITTKITKKALQQSISVLLYDKNKLDSFKIKVSDNTSKNFEKVFQAIDKYLIK